LIAALGAGVFGVRFDVGFAIRVVGVTQRGRFVGGVFVRVGFGSLG